MYLSQNPRRNFISFVLINCWDQPKSSFFVLNIVTLQCMKYTLDLLKTQSTMGSDYLYVTKDFTRAELHYGRPRRRNIWKKRKWSQWNTSEAFNNHANKNWKTTELYDGILLLDMILVNCLYFVRLLHFVIYCFCHFSPV